MTKRIIPCLDIRDGRVVKGKKFKNIQDVAEPVELAKQYEADLADVLFLLDISGSDRTAFLQIVRDIRAALSIPIYVGGGVRSVEDVVATLDAGATKVSITSAAIERPELLAEACSVVGGDRIVLSIDAKEVAPNKWHAFTQGGKKDSGRDVVEWAQFGESAGVSEILLNSIDTDGVKDGFHLALNMAVQEAVAIPVIASGGAGAIEHFYEVLAGGYADAALAASVFHYGEFTIREVKRYLNDREVEVKTSYDQKME